MSLVIIESPYAGDVERSARAALADSLRRGESPFASHLLYTQPGVLDDSVPAERAQGIAAGFAWGAVADLVAVYCDLGITPGMQDGIDAADERGARIVYRDLPGWADAEVMRRRFHWRASADAIRKLTETRDAMRRRKVGSTS
jgi:hypothetical protein